MNVLTRQWNDSGYNVQHVFQDVRSGQQITIPAGQAEKVRAMKDSVASGAYTQVSP